MRKARQSGIERLEKYLVKVILEKGADQNQPFPMSLLLGFLKVLSVIFAGVVAVRYFFYRIGLLRRYPLGIQVISIGNVTAGGTGKTP
ncbi:MAG: tetraacyldisaccharide 4'-kinase, partial [Kiritimatiellae bacterium]|nr:tetraacyldisaccharide 4'-kinase [Kiritimatiellia bacterium]